MLMKRDYINIGKKEESANTEYEVKVQGMSQ